MVLGEFTAEEKEIIFSDMDLRRFLINGIKEKGVKEAEDVIINLALEYLLEQLENPDKEEDNETFISGIKEVYLMANYDYISNNINYEIEDVDSIDVPEELTDRLEDSYENYLNRPSENPKLTYEEFKATVYNLGKAEIILNNAEKNLTAKTVELAEDKKRIANIEAKIEELKNKLR